MTTFQATTFTRTDPPTASLNGVGSHGVIDQASRLREMARRQRRAKIIAVTSGKGGVGKSNVAVNLSIELARGGRRVILLDADLGLANADVLLNVPVKSNIAHFVARQRRLDEVLIDAPGGIKLVAGASGLSKMADLPNFDRQRLVMALAELEAEADNIVVDTGAGISQNVLSFARAADQVLVVTTPEPTAITDAYAVVKVMVRSRESESDAIATTSLLVNQARSTAEASRAYQRVEMVARQFLGMKLYDAGFVPFDPAVSAAVRARVPFVLGNPRSAAARSIAELAKRLEAGLENPVDGGLVDRLARKFGF